MMERLSENSAALYFIWCPNADLTLDSAGIKGGVKRETGLQRHSTMFSLVLLLPAYFSYLLTTTPVQAADVNYVFNLGNGAVAPDGYSRAGALVNGVFPATLIQANKDDTLHITVNNALINPNMRYAQVAIWTFHGILTMTLLAGAVPLFTGTVLCVSYKCQSVVYSLPMQFQARTASEDGREFIVP